jgi:hypothetical protein
MRKQMIENAAFDVATQVRAVEDCIETALAEIAELQGKMIHARAVTGIGIGVGHSALEQLVGATQGLVSARGGIANCHAALVEARGHIPGLRTVSFGDGDECPPSKATVDLRVVA